MKPPNDEYRKPYSGETVLTADRKPIVNGLRVFTNNLDAGVVDLSRAEYEWNGSEGRYVLWFDVLVDTSYKGEPTQQRVMQSDDRVATLFEGRQP
jgi:hypothetical protein